MHFCLCAQLRYFNLNSLVANISCDSPASVGIRNAVHLRSDRHTHVFPSILHVPPIGRARLASFGGGVKCTEIELRTELTKKMRRKGAMREENERGSSQG